ncbi:uncharacterized protein [Anabrus simplex]|uniref:uncharacterized protein n=1 Tax=Anabrus simplex TaxID=316456 RepID=UPI0035A30DD7
MPLEIKDQVLTSPSWLDKDFIQRALRAGDEDSNILSYHVSMANAVGDGMGSDMYRVAVKLQNSEELRLIVKCQPEDGAREAFIRKTNAFDKETNFFTVTLPAMSKLLEVAESSEYRPLAAKCLYHGKNSVQFLVLEDLRQSGFTLVNSLEDMDLAHCTLAAKALARFHASSLALLEQNPNAFQSYMEPLYSEDIREDMTPFFQSTLHSLEHVVAKWPGYEKFSEKIKHIRENIYDIFLQSMTAKSGELKTLIHADVWYRNLMFKYSDTCVTDIKLVDFQLCFYSSPTIDLHHFLSVCPNAEVRDNSIDFLVQVYHSTLLETLDILHCSKYKITLQNLKKDFENHLLYGFIVTALYLPLTMVDPSQKNLNDLLDQNSSVNNSCEDVMKSSFYERIMKKLLLKCEKLGVI